MGSWLSKEVIYFPHNLSRNGVKGKKPSSSSGSAKDSKSLAQSSLGISSPMRDKKVSSSANIMVPFSFLSYNLHNLIEFAEFLLNIVSLAVFDANLLGEVHAHGVEDIHEVVHVKDTLAMPIIDVADPLNFISINRHGWLILFDLFQKTFRQLPTPRPSC